MDYQTTLSTVAVVLTFVGYVPYVSDILKGKTKPHSFTWFVWAFVGGIVFALQVFGGAGVGSWSILAGTVICVVIFFLSLRIGKKDIQHSDIVFLGLSLVALFLWLVVKQPVWSIILITAVDFTAFVPTVRKSWNNPHTETLFTYEIFVLRHGLSVFALQQINILTALNPIAWVFANLLFSMILVVRRKQTRIKDSI